MKKFIIIAGILLVSLTACKKGASEEKTLPQPDQLLPSVPAQKQCYQFVKGKDIVSLSYIRNGDNVSGELAYQWFEKDKSHGNFTGVFKGDTLHADFTFQSEGTTSVREIVFLKKKNTLLQGNGDMQEKGNRQVFTAPSKLVFDTNMVLEKVTCK